MKLPSIQTFDDSMRPMISCMPRIRSLVVALLLGLAVVRPAAAVDWTDLWWNGAESGWGVNFVQADNFIFATFFVYGADQKATWFTGQMSVDANGVWSGPLYQTTGPYYGGVWDPTQRTTTQVGTVTFNPTSSYSGTLTYNVNNVNVSKVVSRQTLKTIPLGGTYIGGIFTSVTSCNDSSQNGTISLYTAITATQIQGGALTLDFAINQGGSCRFAGNWLQDGQLYRINTASYTCGTTFSTTAFVSQIKATAQGIEGQWNAPVGGGCQETGFFSAVLQ